MMTLKTKLFGTATALGLAVAPLGPVLAQQSDTPVAQQTAETGATGNLSGAASTGSGARVGTGTSSSVDSFGGDAGTTQAQAGDTGATGSTTSAGDATGRTASDSATAEIGTTADSGTTTDMGMTADADAAGSARGNGADGASGDAAATVENGVTPGDSSAAQVATTEYSDEDLNVFVDAALKVSAVGQSFQQQMQTAESDEDRAALADEARVEMRAAVEATDGIDVATYNEIGQAYRADPELNQRVAAIVAERMPGTSSDSSDG